MYKPMNVNNFPQLYDCQNASHPVSTRSGCWREGYAIPGGGPLCFPWTLRLFPTGLGHRAAGLLVSCGLCLGAGSAPSDRPRGRPNGSGWAWPMSWRGSGVGESCRLCPGVVHSCLHWTRSPSLPQSGGTSQKDQSTYQGRDHDRP